MSTYKSQWNFKFQFVFSLTKGASSDQMQLWERILMHQIKQISHTTVYSTPNQTHWFLVINVDPKSNGLHKAYFTRAGNKGSRCFDELAIPIGSCSFKDE